MLISPLGYRTTDRGLTWSGRLDGVPHDGDDWNQARIDSVTVVIDKLSSSSSSHADVYMTTEGAGLWHSTYDPKAVDGGLRFTQQMGYPFSHPTRVVRQLLARQVV